VDQLKINFLKIREKQDERPKDGCLRRRNPTPSKLSSDRVTVHQQEFLRVSTNNTN
jgi:hypothetical protein